MQFRTRLDYSNNRQIKQHPETLTILSGATSFGLTFSGLTTGPDLNTSAITQTYYSVVSTFSGNNTTTNYNWYDSRMALGEINLTALTPTYSASTQQTGPIFSVATTTVIDGNTVNLTYTGVSFDVIATSMNDLGGGDYSGTVLTNILEILSANTLGFTSRTIWADVSGITRTERLIITKNPQIGNVWTCIDSEGMGEWSSISSGTTLNWYAENSTAPTTSPIASGSSSIALGDGAQAIYSNMFVYGDNAAGGAGGESPNISNSNFLGYNAGYDAYRANNSNFLGYNVGYNAINAYQSNFLGNSAGYSATNANNSNFIGQNAGYSATNASGSTFLGYYAGYSATNAYESNFLGQYAGNQATNAYQSNFIGSYAGNNVTSVNNSNFLGYQAGAGATSAYESNFLGQSAGYNATNANRSNFLGNSAGYGGTNAYESNFLGYQTGYNATDAQYSNFMGTNAGSNATYANYSNFLGYESGYGAFNASFSNLFGYNTGRIFTGNDIGSNNIIIGTNISLPNGTSNAINIGGVLFGINTYSNTITNPSTAATASGSIGIGVVTPTEGLDVALNARIRTIGSSASAGALHYDANGVLTTNTSDSRLKTNVTQLTNSLDKVKQLRGVTYKWNENLTGQTRIGFIAQEVEAVVPELTFVNDNSPEKYMGVHYDNITALLVEAVKELSSGITSQNIFNENNKELPNTLTIPLYTPTSSFDENGNDGNMTRDNNYLYIKTNNKWGRINLENF